jgi:nicotinamidase-related amidase
MSDKLTLNPKETAVVFIEFQNEFTTEGGGLHDAVKDCMKATKTIENSKTLLEAARNEGCTVIHVPIVFDEVSEDSLFGCSFDSTSLDSRKRIPSPYFTSFKLFLILSY